PEHPVHGLPLPLRARGVLPTQATDWRRNHIRLPTGHTVRGRNQVYRDQGDGSFGTLEEVRKFYRSSNTYSCWASRRVRVLFALEPTTKANPFAPGAVVMNEIVPSGFFREAISLFHSPKSNTVVPPLRWTAISPKAALA